MSSILEMLRDNFMALLILTTLLGLLVGSFLNVVIHRIPLMLYRDWRAEIAGYLPVVMAENPKLPADAVAALTKSAEALQEILPNKSSRYNLVVPRSACPKCGHQITALQNLPIISYLFQKGRCRGCKAAISMRYPLVEFLTGLCSAALVYHFGFGLPLLASLVFTWILIALAFIDADTQLLPDNLLLPLLWLGIIVNYYGGTFVTLPSAILGAVVGYLVLWSVSALYQLIRGEPGMGNGDFKLLACFGAWGGLVMIPQVLLIAPIAGLLVVAILKLSGYPVEKKIPFGPYLVLAGWTVFVFGEHLGLARLFMMG